MAAAYGSDEGPLDDVYRFHSLRPGTVEIGPLRVTTDRVAHPVETYGVRIEHAGSSIAYSADTAPCDALVRLAVGADLFLCEASYLDSDENPPGLHMTGGEAGEAATKAGAKRLLLTHLVSAWGSERDTLDAASGTFAGPVEIARPGAAFNV
jgi:ribonuclease BN (tRNA processing enzyme)